MANSPDISAGTTAISPFREKAGNKRIHEITSYKQRIARKCEKMRCGVLVKVKK
jgi:hypothetical protein